MAAKVGEALFPPINIEHKRYEEIRKFDMNASR
jgi:hypothetical protein